MKSESSVPLRRGKSTHGQRKPASHSGWWHVLIYLHRGMGTNVVVKANRGKALGWKPKHNESILDAIPDMLAAVVN